MGKRKSSSKPAPKGKKDTLSTSFKCLFCNHEKSCSVILEKKNTMFGKLRCKDCGQNFQTPINSLSAAVDVYADWVDACEEARLQQPPKERPQRNPDTLNHGFAGGARMTMIGNEEDDQDAEGEDAPEDDDDADSLDALAPSKKQKSNKRDDRRDNDDDDDDEEDDARARKRRTERIRLEKAKRVQMSRGARPVDDDDDDSD